ncbi:lipopolysaccharide assembly protein LapA domain-containing protein [Pseudomonas sp. E2-15]
MRAAKRLVLVLGILFFAFVVIAFVLENQQSATLSFLGWSTAELPISVIATLALLVGMIIGPALVLVFSGRKVRKKV